MNRKIKKVLKQFTEVKWDRFVAKENWVRVFGWIKRKDGKRDFLVIDFLSSVVMDFCTSSAKYSKLFSERLNFKHTDCKKVKNL